MADQHLLVGETMSVPVQAGQLTIEDGRILRAKRKGKQYEIEALAPGTSTYQLGGQTETVFVQSVVFQKTSQTLTNLVRQSLSFRVGQKNGEVEVTGKLVRFRDWEKLVEGCAHIICRYIAAFEIPAAIFPKSNSELRMNFYIGALVRSNSYGQIRCRFKFLKPQKICSRWRVAMVSRYI